MKCVSLIFPVMLRIIGALSVNNDKDVYKVHNSITEESPSCKQEIEEKLKNVTGTGTKVRCSWKEMQN